MIINALNMQTDCVTHLFWVLCYTMDKGMLFALRELNESQKKGDRNVSHMLLHVIHFAKNTRVCIIKKSPI